MNKRFYVTTPIYYVNAKPHIGSLYSTLIADTITRWQTLQGHATWFVTGADEHGQKVAQAAAQAGMEPQAYVDSLVPAFKSVWDTYNIQYNTFIRTTSTQHVHGAQQFIAHLLQTGDVYKSTYEGWYCVGCETFVTEKESTDQDVIICPDCGRQTSRVSEETYFFKLSAYQDKLLDFYKKNPNFIAPKERFNEVIRFVEGGLKDLSISRTTVPWGVPFPGDAKHTIYVWAEALCNYITAVGYGDASQKDFFASTWPADVQVVGKDIVRFHAVYWPAFLMAAGLALPKRLLVHGWILMDQQKMSKSRGTVVDPIALQEAYGVDAVRYYLLKQIPITQDGNFSTDDLEQTITSDLANNLGNLFNRMVTLAHKYDCLSVNAPETWSHDARAVQEACAKMVQEYERHMQNYMFHLAINEVLHFLHTANAYFHAQEPWKLAKQNMDAFKEVMSVVAHSVRAVAYLFMPLMPEKMHTLLGALGVAQEQAPLKHDHIVNWHMTCTLSVIPPLFTKPEPKAKDAAVQDQTHKIEEQTESYIAIDDVAKVQLRVGTIKEAYEVEKSDKLVRVIVDFGDHGTRQIMAGIKQWHAPDTLIGKQATFVYNLKPRKMMGMESQGMMLLAQDAEGNLQLVQPAHVVPSGTQLR